MNEPPLHDKLRYRLDEKDTDEELCWMEKPLEETTIEMPTKASLSLSETDNEPASSHLPNTSSELQKASPEPEKKASASEETSSSHADSLSHLLPSNTFAQISPRCYMFPGAEVTLDNMEGDSDDSEDDFSDEEDEEENETASSNEIIVPDIDNVLSNEVPVPEISPTPTTSSSLSPAPSTSQLQCNDHETVENIIDIQADDATDDLEPSPIKRPRLANSGEVF